MVKVDDPRLELAGMIFRAYEAGRDDWRREHLGASVLGRECLREIWNKFRWWAAPSFPGRMLRLFERGQREEAWLCDDLRAAGIEVSEFDPDLPATDENGDDIPISARQYRFSLYGGHLGGSMDALLRKVPLGGNKEHVGEFKTHNDRSFKLVAKNGVAKAKPEHYVQVQLYMYWRGLERAVYVAVNKNTDEIYVERVRLDVKLAVAYEEIGRSIIFDDVKPPKVSENPTYYKCKFCDFQEHCHRGAPPEKNCRTCKHSFPTEDGAWRCGASTVAWSSEVPKISLERQKKGCDKYEVFE